MFGKQDQVLDNAAAVRALGIGQSGVAAELGDSEVLHAETVDRRREVIDKLGTPKVIAALEQAGKLDALAADDASELPDSVHAAARRYLDTLVAGLLASYEAGGEGQLLARTEEFETVLERLGLGELRQPILARMQEDVASFVRRSAEGLLQNPLLVATAAEFDGLPEDLLLPPALDPKHAEVRRGEIRLFLTYTQVLDAIATECLLEPRGDGEHPERTFIHQMYAATSARLEQVEWKERVSLFERMKVPSVHTPFQNRYMSHKTGEKDFDAEASGGHTLQLNILEAMFQDTLLGWDDNASAGFELFCQSIDKEPQLVLGEDLTREWVRDGVPMGVPVAVTAFVRAWNHLYVSWNAAFVMNYDEAPYFLAKLFNPSVCSIHQREPGLFMYTRIVTLLLHITFVMTSRDAEGWGPHFSALPWRHDGINLLWGRINLAASDAYQRRVEGALEDKEGFAENLDYDAWRVAKLGVWGSVRALTRAIGEGNELGERAGETFERACELLGLGGSEE